MYQVRIDWKGENDPIFDFEKLSEAVSFIEICFNNGYDVHFRKATNEFE